MLLAFAGFVVGSLAGYGGNMLVLPGLAWLMGDVQAAVFTVLILGSVQAVHVALINLRHVDWPVLGSMVVWAGLGVPLGVAAARYLPERPLLAGLGVVIAASGLWRLLTPQPTGADNPAVRRSLLLAGGVLQGAFASGGGPIVVAAQRTLPTKEAFRATLFAFWNVLNLLAAAGMLTAGGFRGRGSWTLVLLGLPVVVLANLVGDRLARRVPQAHFVRVVASLLVVAGIVTLARAV